MAITDVLKDDDFKHLVETVCDTCSIFLSNFFCVKVGRDDGELLLEIAILQKVCERIGHIAIVKHLYRLLAEVVDGK